MSLTGFWIVDVSRFSPNLADGRKTAAAADASPACQKHKLSVRTISAAITDRGVAGHEPQQQWTFAKVAKVTPLSGNAVWCSDDASTDHKEKSSAIWPIA